MASAYPLQNFSPWNGTFSASLLAAQCIKVVDNTASLLTITVFSSLFSDYLPSARATFPSSVIWFSEKFLAAPIRSLRTSLVARLPALYTTFSYGLKERVNWTFLFVSSVLEELADRWLVQSVILTEFPKLVLRKIAPQYEEVMDHKIMKIARIIFTALIFSLQHMIRCGNFPGLLVTHFLAGVYFSYLREQKSSILELSAVHLAHNALLVALTGGL